MTTDYLDVFTPTQNLQEATATSNTILFVGLMLSLGVGFWLTSGMPGFPDLSSKAHDRWIKVFMGLMAVGGVALVGGGVASTVITVTESNKIMEVQGNMSHNVKEKYGYDLSAPRELPVSEDRDDDLPYSLAVTPVNTGETIYKTFLIRFDRETNEPFISDVVTPTADEIEEKVKK